MNRILKVGKESEDGIKHFNSRHCTYSQANRPQRWSPGSNDRELLIGSLLIGKWLIQESEKQAPPLWRVGRGPNPEKASRWGFSRVPPTATRSSKQMAAWGRDSALNGYWMLVLSCWLISAIIVYNKKIPVYYLSKDDEIRNLKEVNAGVESSQQ